MKKYLIEFTHDYPGNGRRSHNASIHYETYLLPENARYIADRVEATTRYKNITVLSTKRITK